MSTLPFNIRNNFARLSVQQVNDAPKTTVALDIVGLEGDAETGCYQLTADVNFVITSENVAVRLPRLDQQSIGKIIRIHNSDDDYDLAVYPYQNQKYEDGVGELLTVTHNTTTTLIAVKHNDWKLL